MVLQEDLLEDLNLAVVFEKVDVCLDFGNDAQNIQFGVTRVVHVFDATFAFLLRAVIGAQRRRPLRLFLHFLRAILPVFSTKPIEILLEFVNLLLLSF